MALGLKIFIEISELQNALNRYPMYTLVAAGGINQSLGTVLSSYMNNCLNSNERIRCHILDQLNPCHTRAAFPLRSHCVLENCRTPWKRSGIAISAVTAPCKRSAISMIAVGSLRAPRYGVCFEHAQNKRRGIAIEFDRSEDAVVAQSGRSSNAVRSPWTP